MPLKPYGVLKGQPLKGFEASDTTHYEVHVVDDFHNYRLAVNIKSKSSPPELLYYIDENYKNPILSKLQDLPDGFKRLDIDNDGLAIDYIRENLFGLDTNTRYPMKIAPHIDEEDNELADIVGKYIQEAITTGDAVIYAYGQSWGPQNKRDQYFGFKPSYGVHDIHMNQGNEVSSGWEDDNGTYQDGALFIHFPSKDKWIACFFAFQSQSFHTNDNGDPL